MKILLVLFASACVAMADFDFWPPHYKRTSLSDSIDVATMKILKVAYDAAEDKNIVSSPLGLMLLLSLYNKGTGPGAKSEIAKFLGDNDSKQAHDSFEELSVRLSGMNPDYLTVAQKISVSNMYSLNQTFAAAAQDYHCEFDTLDFSNPEEAAAAINKWAAEKTKGLIKDPVSKDSLSPDIAAALINVIFFRGHWHVPFEAKETKDKDFHLNRDTVVKKQMMHLYRSLFYTESEELGARMIELPYKEKGFRMVVVLPNEVDGLPSVLEKVAEKGLLSDVVRLMPAGRDVDLDMPKFDIKTSLDFNDILPKVGVRKIFEEPAPGIVRETPVVVSKAFQQAFIKVDEEGATAGAFTGVFVVHDSYPPEIPEPMKFTVDHPFLYAILHEDKIIFAGAIAVPESYPPQIPAPMKFTVDHPFLYAILHEDKIIFAGLPFAVPLSYPSRIPEPVKFTVDHPFLYAILLEDKIIFAGTYSK